MSTSKPTSDEIRGKLLQGPFPQNGPHATRLSDPIADTPMVVTLDQLRAYEHNPRLNRNPLYDDIKASILERGLDSPPPITRRPGEEHFIIRNGGNTRLAILNELWSETRDERFFRIHCLFRPWDANRGEIIALTGHLAENDMHGSLSFIERALGVEKARELYQQVDGGPISQSELARRLKADGYPVSQSHISRMQDTIRYLLPVIPNRLYRGLGKHQIEKLLALRSAAEKTWRFHAEKMEELATEFDALFADLLSLQDESEDGEFKIEEFRFELIAQMAGELEQSESTLTMDIMDVNRGLQQQLRERDLDQTADQPAGVANAPASAMTAGEIDASEPSPAVSSEPDDKAPREPKAEPETAGFTPEPPPAIQDESDATDAGGAGDGEPTAKPDLPDSDDPLEIPELDDLTEAERQELVEAYTITPTGFTDKLRRIKRQVAERVTGEPVPDWQESMLHSIPVMVGGLYPLTDLWYIEWQDNEPEIIRSQIHAMAEEILRTVGLPHHLITLLPVGIGFQCNAPLLKELKKAVIEEGVPEEELPSPLADTVFWLLHALSGQFRLLTELAREQGPDQAEVQQELAQFEGNILAGLGQLLIGTPSGYKHFQPDTTGRLCDAALVKLFRIIRLARHLTDLDLKNPLPALAAGDAV